MNTGIIIGLIIAVGVIIHLINDKVVTYQKNKKLAQELLLEQLNQSTYLLSNLKNYFNLSYTEECGSHKVLSVRDSVIEWIKNISSEVNVLDDEIFVVGEHVYFNILTNNNVKFEFKYDPSRDKITIDK